MDDMEEQGDGVVPGWYLPSTVWHWDHFIAEQFLRAGNYLAASDASGQVVLPMLFDYRQALELAIKSLVRVAESKLFQHSYRSSGSEAKHCCG